MTTKVNIALAELGEKGGDADLLREMIQDTAQRMMDMERGESVRGGLRRAQSRAAQQPRRLPRATVGDACGVGGT